VTAVALLLGVLAVSQLRVQDVRSRALELETPASLTALIASLSEKNALLREETFSLRTAISAARDELQRGSTEGLERQLAQLRAFTAQTPVSGPGIAIAVDGPFDDRAMVDLVNELRNAGAEAIAVNEHRIGARSWFAPAGSDAITIDGRRAGGPWMVRTIGDPEVLFPAMTRTGGIIAQFQVIYPSTRFSVVKEAAAQLPAVVGSR
jgi:uncharacterized protein YlxW (UPF0749 family)